MFSLQHLLRNHNLFAEILANIDSIRMDSEPSYLNKLLRGFHTVKTSPIERREKRTGVSPSNIVDEMRVFMIGGQKKYL